MALPAAPLPPVYTCPISPEEPSFVTAHLSPPWDRLVGGPTKWEYYYLGTYTYVLASYDLENGFIFFAGEGADTSILPSVPACLILNLDFGSVGSKLVVPGLSNADRTFFCLPRQEVRVGAVLPPYTPPVPRESAREGRWFIHAVTPDTIHPALWTVLSTPRPSWGPYKATYTTNGILFMKDGADEEAPLDTVAAVSFYSEAGFGDCKMFQVPADCAADRSVFFVVYPTPGM